MRKLHASRLVSVATASIVATLGVALLTYAATTISTNITTGGTLNADDATTLNGAVTLGNAASDVITITGNASTTNSLTVGGNFYVNGFATTTSAGALALGSGLGLGAANTVAKSLLFSPLTSDPTAAAGLVYYNSGSAVLRMSDGTSWFTVGTSTSGLTLSAPRLQLADLNYYMTFGTTTQQGLSILTLEATSTVAIPLTLVARNSQTAHLLNVRNSGSSDLLYIDSGGGLFGSSTLQIGGVVTTYGNMTLGDAAADVLTINAGIAGFVSTASSTVVGVLTTSGQLRASSTSLFTGALTTYGNVTLGDVAGDAIVLTGNASTTNSLTVGGNLIASASSTVIGNFNASGKITSGASSTPYAELGATGSATTTLSLFSTGTNVGSCIELRTVSGAAVRIYATTTADTLSGILRVENGTCK